MFDPEQTLRLCGALARPFEGLSLAPYHDPVGFPTIGYGHLLSRKPYAPLDAWDNITHDQAQLLLAQDMESALAQVKILIKVPLNNHQAAALTDFTYNCGAGNLQISTLLKRLNQGDYSTVPQELNRWVYARGQKLNGLINRRKAEGALWQNQP